MPSSQKTTTKNEKLSSKEVVKILAQVLAKAKKFSGPALLMVEFPTEYTRKETAEGLAQMLEKAKDELVDIDLRKPVNLLEVIEELKPNQVGSVHGLHAQPEVVRRLNWGRERLTDNNKRIVFWLNFEELKDLAERAPDFWAFRNRHLVLSSFVEGQGEFFEYKLVPSTLLALSNLPENAKRERIDALEELIHSNKTMSFRTLDMQEDLALLYADLGDYSKAIKYHKQVLATHKVGQNKVGEGGSLGNLGRIYFDTGDYKNAIECTKRALKIAREVKNLQGEGNHLTSLGNIYSHLDNLHEATEYYEMALEISRKIYDRRGESHQLGNLGIVNLRFHDYSKALASFESSLLISKEIGDKQGQSIDYGNLGIAYTEMGNYDNAIQCLEKGLLIAQEIGYKSGEISHLSNLGNVYDSIGDYLKAITYFKKSLSISREIGDDKTHATQLNNIGSSYRDLEMLREALVCYVGAMLTLKELQLPILTIILINLLTIQNGSSHFEDDILSLFPGGDRLLQKTTGQFYKIFQEATLDTPKRIVAMINDFEKQQNEDKSIDDHFPVRDKSSKFRVI
jgi:tetratricopeptide (TPR) repeat protein